MLICRTLVVLCLLAASQCFAGVLWDQQPFDTSTGYINQVLGYGGSSSYDTYQVHDVTVTGGGWNITSITEYFTSGFGNWPGSFNAKLNIFPLIGSLPQPADDPGSGLSPIYAAQDVGGTVCRPLAPGMVRTQEFISSSFCSRSRRVALLSTWSTATWTARQRERTEQSTERVQMAAWPEWLSQKLLSKMRPPRRP
jgi:hypothetical protein